MALHLNLLHEEVSERRQRQRDPLKIGTKLLVAIGALMLLFYAVKAHRTVETESQLKNLQRDWNKVDLDLTAARKRAEELNAATATTKMLSKIVAARFFWTPLLQSISRCIGPNGQLTAVGGSITHEGRLVEIYLEGIAAGREPRAEAEELRQLLSRRLGEDYSEVNVKFNALEDLDTVVDLAGTNMAAARYIISASFSPEKSQSTQPALADVSER